MGMIKDIYMGNNVPIEKSTDSIKGYRELHLKWLAAYKEMVGLLNDDQKALFEKLLAMYSELNDLFSIDCYESGFRDGAKLMIEILRGGGSGKHDTHRTLKTHSRIGCAYTAHPFCLTQRWERLSTSIILK